MQLLVSIEEMQTQQRAENGIEEIILGYIGHEALIQSEEVVDLMQLGTDFMGAADIHEMGLDDLPDDVRSVVLAEKHRKETGAVLPSEFYKREEVIRK